MLYGRREDCYPKIERNFRMNSITYYNNNAQVFFDRTINIDLQDVYYRFLKYVPEKGRILDVGCGVGRDSKFFINKGYETVSFDGSIEMARIASNLLGKQALHLLFQDVSFANEFHAVWANASLLHIPYEDLRESIQKFYNSLLPSGILYASFKYGSSMRKVEDRLFFDMTEETLTSYVKGLFNVLEIWKSDDLIKDSISASPDKSWIHFIGKRIESNG